jgi:hypothetical protein
MNVYTDIESGLNLGYHIWRPEWEWDFVVGDVYSPYSNISPPEGFTVSEGPDGADILIGCVCLDESGPKRVEVYRGQVYFVHEGKFSLPARELRRKGIGMMLGIEGE